MRILLLRHGQTQGNIDARIQGPDDQLTDLGRMQARLLAAYVVATYTVDHMISSSLSRAVETAEIVAAETKNEISFDPRLAEINNGDAIGMLWTDWRTANPDLAPVWGWDKRHADAAWGGGESGRDVCNRVFAAWDDIVQRHNGSDATVAVVTHGGPIAWLAARLHGDSLDIWPGPYGDIANCSVTEVAIAPSGIGTIERWNITDHLGDSFAPHVSPVIPTRTGKQHA